MESGDMNFNTEVLKLDENLISTNNIEKLMKEEAIKRGAELLQQGEVVAFPTETVYGLGADAINSKAVKKIFAAKGRPQDNPLIVHIADKAQLKYLSDGEIPESVLKLIEVFWPGPLTIIVAKNKEIPDITTGDLNTVAIRMPSHPVALALLKLSSLPIAAPSANSSGYPSPTRAEHVYSDLKTKIPLIINGGQCQVGVESTVININNRKVEVLRPGGVTIEELSAVLGYNVSYCNREYKDETPPSPGMKYRHYSPRTPLILIDRGKINKIEDFIENYSKPVFLITEETAHANIIPDDESIIKIGSRNNLALIAYNLFNQLRELDRADYDLIIVEKLPEKGLGQAIMNRLHRASLKDIYIK